MSYEQNDFLFQYKTQLLVCIYLHVAQESISVECVPPACQPYMLLEPSDVSADWGCANEQASKGLQYWPPDITSRGIRVGGSSCTWRGAGVGELYSKVPFSGGAGAGGSLHSEFG